MNFPYKKALASILSFALTVTGVVPSAQAADLTPPPNCYPDANTLRGLSSTCNAVTRGGVSVAYPKIVWEELGVIDLPVASEVGAVPLARPSQRVGGDAAEVLGLEEKDIIQAINLFPTNTPFVMGRYSVWDASLTIDMFKLERTGTKSRMLRATFSPEHGDYWKAAGAYASPAERAAGGFGRNPFEAFKGGNGKFIKIAPQAAQVALGHAQRMMQAPASIMAVVNSNIRPTTSKRSCSMGLQKCITTKYWLDMDTTWLMGVPMAHANVAQAVAPPGYCISSPEVAGSTCPVNEFATAGVSFIQQDGGTFNGERATDHIGQETKRTWSLLAIILVTFIGGYFLAAMGPSLAAAGGGLGGATGVGAAGLVGGTLQAVGLANFTTALGAAAFEAAVTAGMLVTLGGADLGSSMRVGAPMLASSEIKATASAVDPSNQSNKFVRKGVQMTRARTVEKLEGSVGAVFKTAAGDCGMAGKASDCGSRSQGMIPRSDDLLQANRVELYRDAHGGTVGGQP